MAQKGAGLVGLIRQGWNELPELMIVGAAFLVMTIPGGYCAYRYKKDGKENKRYKLQYVIMRPDDPRVAKVHKD